jgi:hypothetical protein
MLISLAPLALLAQVSAPGPENWAYLTCMTSHAAEVAQLGLSEAGFKQRLQNSCENERSTLRNAIVRQQIAAGQTRKQANADANVFFAQIMEQMLSLRPVAPR